MLAVYTRTYNNSGSATVQVNISTSPNQSSIKRLREVSVAPNPMRKAGFLDDDDQEETGFETDSC